MENKKFAAFVMTYERPEELKTTLDDLLNQSLPPEYILVVDNSQSGRTKNMLSQIPDEKIGYHSMGCNSGPAGAAKFGLKKLNDLGYEWIFWGDDDDPPSDPLEFERCFRNLKGLKEAGRRPGIYGGKGGFLNRRTGRVRSLANYELARSRFQEVDVVPGGHTLLVNSEVIKEGILPDENLFFGFEELDFCLRAKEKGFKIIVDTENWLQKRIAADNTRTNYQWRDSSFGNKDQLWRDYYSSRNLLVILLSHKYYRALIFRMSKFSLKSLAGYKFGWNYGFKNMKVQWKAIFHFLTGSFPKYSP